VTPADIRRLVVELEKLASGATPGPLRVNRYDCDGGAINWQVQQEGGDGDVIANITDDEPKRARADAALFARARTAVPALCDVTAGLLAVVDALPKCDGDGGPCGEIATWSHGTCDQHRYRADGFSATELTYAAALRALAAKEPPR
jgi:hypothetical protein